MKKHLITAMAVFFILTGCTAQNVQPDATVYNITINQTDNSQVVNGNGNHAKTTPVTDTSTVSDNKPDVDADATSTTKNGMWIFWTIAFFATVAGLWIVWEKWGDKIKL